MLLTSTTIDGLNAEAVEARLVNVDSVSLFNDGTSLVVEEIRNFLHLLGYPLIFIWIEDVRFIVVNVESVRELLRIHKTSLGVLQGNIKHSNAKRSVAIGLIVKHRWVLRCTGMLLIRTQTRHVEDFSTTVVAIKRGVEQKRLICRELTRNLIIVEYYITGRPVIDPCCSTIAIGHLLSVHAAEVVDEAATNASTLSGEYGLTIFNRTLHPRVRKLGLRDVLHIDIAAIEAHLKDVSHRHVLHGIRFRDESGRRRHRQLIDIR